MFSESLLLEVLKISVTAILTASLTYWFSYRKELGKIKYENAKDLLNKAYDPIIKIINQSVIAGEGYDGLNISEVEEIIEIIENNSALVEPKLESYAWGFKEEIRINSYSNTKAIYDIYDSDEKFLDYINYKYNKLKKSLYLPYSRNSFFFPKMYRKFVLWKDRQIRMLRRKFRRKVKK